MGCGYIIFCWSWRYQAWKVCLACWVLCWILIKIQLSMVGVFFGIPNLCLHRVLELVATFRQYFDHSDFLSAEWKYFLREFEAKRSNEDKEATTALLRQHKLTNSIADSFGPFEKHLDQLNASCQLIEF